MSLLTGKSRNEPDPEIHLHRGCRHQINNELEEAIACYQNAISCDPHHPAAFTNLGKCYQKQGEFKKGLKCYQQALKKQPESPDPKWLYHLSLPVIYQSSQEIAFYRNRFKEGLETLIATTELETPAQHQAAAAGIGSMTNFYLPQFDHIFPGIAGEVPHAQFVFLSHSSVAVTRQFRTRLDRAFAARNLDSNDFCVFLPRLNFPDFLSLNLAADALLDTLGWSGGKTTLEGLWCGLPVVTCPGNFMRGRHTYAMLQMMGIDSTIAADENDYVHIAVRLGMDGNWYAAQKKLVADNKGKLFNDRSCIRGLENFYRAVVNYSVPDPATAKVADPTY